MGMCYRVPTIFLKKNYKYGVQKSYFLVAGYLSTYSTDAWRRAIFMIFSLEMER